MAKHTFFILLKMKKSLITFFFIVGSFMAFAQTDITEQIPKRNTSEETVIKIIKIRTADGEEKIIKQEETITKSSAITLDSLNLDKLNVDATYGHAEVSIKKSNPATSANINGYIKVLDKQGFLITLMDESGSRIGTARPLKHEYFLLHFRNNNYGIGYFDPEDNFILETYDRSIDQVIPIAYRPM